MNEPEKRKLHVVPNLSKSEVLLIVDDDEHIRMALAASLERDGRTIVTCSDIESAELMVEALPVTTVVADVRLSGPFAFEGLDFVRHITSLRSNIRTILMTGNASPEMEREARARGAVALMIKPFGAEELEVVLASNPPAGEGSRIIEVPDLDTLLRRSVYSVFLPIMRLTDRGAAVYGFEALTRARTDTPFVNPELLFRYAERKSRLHELELHCTATALAEGARLAEHGMLFINLHPRTLSLGPALATAIRQSAKASGIALDRLVLEITEQAAIDDVEVALGAIDSLRADGVRFAFDDIGIAYSHLLHLERIRPSFLKISQHFGTSFEGDDSRRKIVRNIASLAHDFGCELILEGVETDETIAAARAIGIPLLQGYAFGRPARPQHLLEATA